MQYHCKFIANANALPYFFNSERDLFLHPFTVPGYPPTLLKLLSILKIAYLSSPL
jgi:hypothetical protein